MGTGLFLQRAARLYKGTAIVVLNSLLALTALEIGACAVVKIGGQSTGGDRAPVNPRENVNYYRAQDWGARYWNEHRLSDVELYHPYVVWRRAPFEGRTINIDSRGFRVTPGASCAPGSYTVFALGGSTMWGTGSPQWGTIPAYLQAGLQALTDRPVCLVNLGESGFVSAQEVVQLLVLLEAGHRPDLVLFYDGVNDVYAAYQSGQASAHMNLRDITGRFEARRSEQSLIGSAVRASYSFRLADYLAALGRRAIGLPQNVITYESTGLDTSTVADMVTKAYLANYTIVKALSQEYGFQYILFWQPAIWLGKKPLTNEEQGIALSADPGPVKLSKAVVGFVEAAIGQATHQNLHSLVSVFDTVDPGLWIDWAHVTPVGNRLIAEEMIRIITARDHAKWKH